MPRVTSAPPQAMTARRPTVSMIRSPTRRPTIIVPWSATSPSPTWPAAAPCSDRSKDDQFMATSSGNMDAAHSTPTTLRTRAVTGNGRRDEAIGGSWLKSLEVSKTSAWSEVRSSES